MNDHKEPNICRTDLKDLKELLEAKLTALEKRTDEKFQSSEQAVKEAFSASQMAIDKAERSMEKRSDAVYVTIASLQQMMVNFINREEFTTYIKNNDDKALILNKAIEDGKLAATKLITIDAYEVRHSELQRQVTEIKDTITRMQAITQGQNKGLNMAWAWILGGITAVGAIVALILNALRLMGAGL